MLYTLEDSQGHGFCPYRSLPPLSCPSEGLALRQQAHQYRRCRCRCPNISCVGEGDMGILSRPTISFSKFMPDSFQEARFRRRFQEH